jgi:IS605 OrfB family transposase
MISEMTLTYQTRPRLDKRQEIILHEYACLLSSIERSLYAEVAKGSTTTSCKNVFLKIYGITARQFNSCRVSLEGKISSCKTSQSQAIKNLKQQLDCLDIKIKQLEKKPSKYCILHQKKRRRDILSHRLSCLEKDQEQGIVHLCFGGKKLFRAQFHLEKNGFDSHQQWKERWEAKRCSEFFILGSKDETSGNQTCTAILKEGALTLRLRLPKALEKKYGKYLEIDNVNFVYGMEVILASLNDPHGQAVSYRFKKDEKGWRVFASTALKKKESLSQEDIGVIGIDLNSDHIAYAETDRFGNLIEKKTYSWISYGKSNDQLKALTGDLCKEIIKKANEAKKPIVIEKLDFQKKKQFLKGNDKSARLLSSFAYGLFFSFLKASAFKHGITVHIVNPAYTSLIGLVNYAKRYGLSSHLAAAFCIARRYQNFSESPCSSEGKVPDGKGSHVAFVLPVRNRTKHVWHFWAQVRKKLTTALAAHFRAMRNRSLSPVFDS